MSQTQVAEAVGIHRSQVLRFLESETAKAVLGKEEIAGHVEIERTDSEYRNSIVIKTVPLNAATAFWVVQSTKGNEKASNYLIYHR